MSALEQAFAYFYAPSMKTFYPMIIAIMGFEGALLTYLAYAYHAKSYEPYRISMQLSMKTPTLKRLINIAYIAVLSLSAVFGLTFLAYKHVFYNQAASPLRTLVEVIGILVVYDFLYYWLHRLMHTTRGMRWIHGRHHEVRNPTAMESFYLTPAELFAGLGLLLFTTWLLGPVSIYSYAAVFFFHSTLNICVHSGLVSKKWFLWPIDVLTQKHYVHHAGNYNNNYASLTPFWDMLFGTRG